MTLAIAYARISKEKDDGFSIETQLQRIAEYAARHGLSITHTFSETFTGRLLDRPELAKARELIRARKVRALIVYATDRLARDTGVANLLLDECFTYGIELHIVQWDGKVHDTPEDRLRFEFESLFSGHERRKIRERTMRGRRAKVESGVFLGGGWTLYGYRVVGERRDTHLEINETEAQAVRLVFGWYADGVGVAEIARRLEREGYISPGESKAVPRRIRPNGEWSFTGLYKILHDSAYIGRYEYYRESDTPVIVEVPAIISDELWQRAQERLAVGRQQSIRNAKYPYLMSRRLICSCGRTIQTNARITQSNINLYYRCGTDTSRDARPHCGLPYFHADIVDMEAWKLLKELICDPQTIRAKLRQSQQNLERRNAELRERLARIDAQITKQNNKLQFLLDMAAEEYATAPVERKEEVRSMFKQQAAEVKEQTEGLRQEREKLAVHLEDVSISDEYIDDWEQLSKQYQDKLENATHEQRRELVDNRNLRGTLAVEDGVKVVYFHLYDHKFRRVVGTDFSSPGRSKESSHQPVITFRVVLRT